jgi:selenocysteine-specific elongation factor
MALVDERGSQGLASSDVMSRAGALPDERDAVTRRLVEAGEIQVVGDLLVSRRVLEATAEKLIELLSAHHAANPLSDGVHREEARARLLPHAPSAVFDAALAPLVSGGRITSRERLSLAGHSVSLTAEESRIRDALVRLFFDAGLAPPDAAAARATVGGPGPVADRILNLLIRQRILVKVDAFVFHAERLDALKADMRALKASGADLRVDVAAFKERYGITRKFAIPLLEYLDRERITKRVGEERVLI